MTQAIYIPCIVLPALARLVIYSSAILSIMLLAGCASVSPPASELAKPRASVMVPPKELPEVKKGDDLYQATAQCSAEYVRVAGQLRSCQGYVRTIQKK